MDSAGIAGNDIMKTAVELLEIPSPTGCTAEVMEYIAAYLDERRIRYERTRKGAILAEVPGVDDEQRRLVTAHVDTLGAMIKEIKGDGTLKLSLVGSSVWNHLEGAYCTILSEGRRFTGTILMRQTAVHVYRDAAEAKRDGNSMEVRVDAKVASKEDAEKLGMAVGDFVAFDPRVQVTEDGFLKSRHLDDKASAAVLLHWLDAYGGQDQKLPHTTYFLFSNREETGQGGSSNVSPRVVEYVAVDMGALGDGQAGDEYSVSICAKDSSGPYDLRLRRHLVRLAQEQKIPYHVDIYPYYGSDASSALTAGHDVIHGLMGPGIAASHAFERTHQESLEASAALLHAYLFSPLCTTDAAAM